MLAWQLCVFSGDRDRYCLETLYFCDFLGGVSRPPVHPSGSAHDLTICFNAINLGLFVGHNKGSISLIIVFIYINSAYYDYEMLCSVTIH